MKTTYNWLQNFVDIKISPEKLADKLTMAGIEVKGIEEKFGDKIFEIEITSNRPDWLSVIGLAREVAAVTGEKIKKPPVVARRAMPKSKERFEIVIENKQDCPLYSAKIIRDVKIGPSPEWLKKRIEAIGLRSINNVVDVTNYVLFTYGQPLHAFDFDKLNSDTIVIRRARNNESIVCIDEIKRNLTSQNLIIADKSMPLAIAGVIGGKPTEVDNNTKNILLESAVFSAVNLRRSRQAVGLQTDSSYRFERQVDIDNCLNAAAIAAGLICEVSGGKLVLEVAKGVTKTGRKNIALEFARLNSRLGIDIKPVKVKQILSALGLKIKGFSAKGIKVEAPSFRQDLKSDVDLIEEIARVYGYENIPSDLSAVYPKVDGNRKRKYINWLKDILTSLGAYEAITYSLVDRNWLKGFTDESKFIEVANPLSREQDVLRTTLAPSLLNAVSVNVKQNDSDVALFEIANIYRQSSKEGEREKPVLAIVLSGARSLLLSEGKVVDKYSLLHVKGIIEKIFTDLGIKKYNFDLDNLSGRISVKIDNCVCGEVFAFGNQLREKFEIKNREVYFAQIDLEQLFLNIDQNKKLKALAIFPSINRDISLVIGENIKADEILEFIKLQAGELLEEVRITDYYKGKQIPAGLKSITISCIYRSAKETLTDNQISAVHNAVCNELIGRFQVKIR